MSEIALGPGAEFDLIRRFFAGRERAARPADVLVGPGDDCAVIAPGLALTTDMAVEDVHFRRDWLEPEEIGYRAAAAALSDLAAVAARPIGILVSLAIRAGEAGTVSERVSAGAHDAAARVGASVLGGDLVRSSGPLVIDVAAVGAVERPVLRAGARPGQHLWVTGSLGGAAAAVRAWLDGREPAPDARAAFARPAPRTSEALWLVERITPGAMIDLSDGLAPDSGHIAAASGVGILLEAGAIPIHPAAGRMADPLRLALAGGEDYELCFTADAGAVEPIAADFEAEFGLRLDRVGVVRKGRDVYLREADGSETPAGGAAFRHFEGDDI